jgi:hypothetical protein
MRSEKLTAYMPKTKLGFYYVRLGVVTAVTLKNAIFLDVTPCGFCKNRDISEQHITPMFRMTRLGEVVTTLAETSN